MVWAWSIAPPQINNMAIPGTQIPTDVIWFKKFLSQESPISKRTEPASLKPRLKVTKVSSIELDLLRATFSSIAIKLQIDGQHTLRFYACPGYLQVW